MARRILTVVGARPQFVKAAVVSMALAAEPGIQEIIVHTDQHYDRDMSQVFFDDLAIPRPWRNLGIGSGTHGDQTGRMLPALEKAVIDARPHLVLVYGDTNSTLAGTLAAAKLGVPVAHVEAGLRSRNMAMAEEINRIVTDRLSTFLFCPTEQAVKNLAAEGIPGLLPCRFVECPGDVMYDSSLFFRGAAESLKTPHCGQEVVVSPTTLAAIEIVVSLGVGDGFVLMTCHRAENTDDPERLGAIFSAVAEISRSIPVVLPLHPRTRLALAGLGMVLPETVRVLPPVGYLEMLALEGAAALVITDSGGMQKEAFFFGVPCVTIRDETEWSETVGCGVNAIAGADRERIVFLALSMAGKRFDPGKYEFYGTGDAAVRIARFLAENS